MRYCVFLLLVLSSAMMISVPGTGASFHLAQRPKDDDYMAGLLALALESHGGDHDLAVTVMSFGTQSRALRSIADKTTPANIYYSGYSRDREQELSMVAVPLTRGLLGYRLLAVRAEDEGRLSEVRSIEDMRDVRVGSGKDWPDTRILQQAGLRVVTASGANFWHLLHRHRFDVFPRGMNEITFEFRRPDLRKHLADMTVDPHLMLAYRLDYFFYMAKEDAALAQIVEAGLKKAYENGSFMAYFNQYEAFQGVIKDQARLKRKVLWLDNPDLSDTVRAIPERFWHPLD